MSSLFFKNYRNILPRGGARIQNTLHPLNYVLLRHGNFRSHPPLFHFGETGDVNDSIHRLATSSYDLQRREVAGLSPKRRGQVSPFLIY